MQVTDIAKTPGLLIHRLWVRFPPSSTPVFLKYPATLNVALSRPLSTYSLTPADTSANLDMRCALRASVGFCAFRDFRDSLQVGSYGMAKVFREGNGPWRLDYVDASGKRTRPVCAATTKTEAKALLALRLAEVQTARASAAGVPSAVPTNIAPETPTVLMTLEELETLWLGHKEGMASVDADRARFKLAKTFFGPKRQVCSITTAEAQAYKSWLLKRTSARTGRKLMPATVNRALVVMKSAMNFATTLPPGERPCEESPFKRVKLLVENNKRDRICTPEEFKRLYDAAFPPVALGIVLAYETGMTEGELCDLEWKHVNLDRHEIAVYRSKTKTHRVVPVSPWAVELLKQWEPRAPKRLVLGITAASFSARFARLTEKLKIPNLHFHDLRHTALTNARRAGADIMTLAAITGHKSLAMVMRYQTIDTADTRAALEKIWKK
jgi:integrase